jgi:hypothetical protein
MLVEDFLCCKLNTTNTNTNFRDEMEWFMVYGLWLSLVNDSILQYVNINFQY